MTESVQRKMRRGVTIVEVLIVSGIVSLLAALVLPAVQSSRESSRQLSCRNNLRQLMLATSGHEAARGAFPVTSVVSGDMVDGKFTTIFASISPHRSLLGYIDPAMFGKMDFNDKSVPYENAIPGSESSANQAIIRASVPVFLCPSDSMPPGGNNYRANMGTGPEIFSQADYPHDGPLDSGNRSGAWVNGNSLRPQHFRDGLSHTIMLSEKIIGDGNRAVYTPHRDRFGSPVDFRLANDAVKACRNYAVPNPDYSDSFSGMTWLFGGFSNTWYNHVVTPNSRVPDCSLMLRAGGGAGLYTARSFHPGGVNAAFGDGAVKFISDSVDIAVWHAISTRAGGDPFSDFD